MVPGAGKHIAENARSSIPMFSGIVPNFPRMFDVPENVREQVPLPGFNVNGETHLFLPDLLSMSNLYSVSIVFALGILFIVWEIPELFSEYRDERFFEKLAEKTSKRNAGSMDDGEEGEDGVGGREDRRGLGWLAAITALAAWTAGIVNGMGFN